MIFAATTYPPISLPSPGELTEVTLPVDRYSRKIKGFAFVTFMFPEKAEQAVAALDGSVFQGRMLHLLPAKLKKTLDEDGDERE